MLGAIVVQVIGGYRSDSLRFGVWTAGQYRLNLTKVANKAVLVAGEKVPGWEH